MTDQFDFDQLWDYNQPSLTERQFRQILDSLEDEEADYRLQLLTQIARTQGLQRNFEQAHQTLDEVETQLSDSTVIARIRYALERGRVFNSSNFPEKARTYFLDAFDLAQAAGQDAFAVDAAHMVAIVEPPAQQLEWNLKALHLAENSPSKRAQKWLGSLYNNIGWTYHDLKQYDAALTIFEKAVVWQEANGQAENIRIAQWCVARTLRSLGRIPEAMRILREIEPQNDGYVYEELGECLLLIGKAAESQPYFARAYQELSKDDWLAANEPERLKRLSELGKTAA